MTDEPSHESNGRASISETLPPFEALGPVDWALGKLFVKTLLEPIVYSVWPDRVDPRDWMRADHLTWAPHANAADRNGDHWFDFIADTGDSDVATYNIAYLFHGGLRVSDPEGLLSVDEPKLVSRLIATPGEGTEDGTLLPRGEFLFIGGDTAYPVADLAQVKARLKRPMDHAFAQRFWGTSPPAPRLLIGIPGNHDWYDSLDGFNRAFRSRSPSLGRSSTIGTLEPFTGYFTRQEASYFSLELPGGWELWALDARDDDDVDYRQQAFFEAQSRRLPKERKLILATPTPPFVYGAQEPWAAGFLASLPANARAATRLWFSGDSHHYARYDAVFLGGRASFTSLVCGLGGAALHAPVAGDAAACIYPSAHVAAAAVKAQLGARLLKRVGMRRLGGILGACIAACVLQPAGEIAPRVDSVLRGNPRVEPLPLWGLASLLLGVLWVVFKLTRRPSEAEARNTPLRRRVLAALAPLLLPVLSLVLASQADGRTFSNVVLDFAFELSSLLLLVGVPVLLVLGLPKPLSPVRVAALGLAGAALGCASISLSIAVARVTRGQLEHLGEGPLLALGAAVTAVAATCLVMSMAFPVLAGFVLRLAFSLGAHRAFVSSLGAIDRFTAFIRFRLRVTGDRSTLTGFVISVATPVTRQALLRPTTREQLVPTAEIVDVFTVR